MVTRVISFINRTETQLLRALQMLRMRYKSVRIDRKLVRGLYTGSITVAY